MAIDPRLKDRCIQFPLWNEEGAAYWYYSPALKLNPGTARVGTATLDRENEIKVTVARLNDCALPADVRTIKVDIFVAVPVNVATPEMSDPKTGKVLVHQLPSTFFTLSELPAGKRATTTVLWTPSSDDPGEAEGPGHKCLIGRCYPEGDTPDDKAFYAPEDRHYAQNNITVVEAPPGGKATFSVATINSSPSKVLDTALLAEVQEDIEHLFVPKGPLEGVLQNPVIRPFAKRGPVTFGLQLPDFPDVVPVERTHSPSGRLASCRAEIALQPRQVTSFTFVADLAKALPGDVHVFHLAQVSGDRERRGDGYPEEERLGGVLLAVLVKDY